MKNNPITHLRTKSHKNIIVLGGHKIGISADIFFWVFPVLFFITAIIGAVRWFSPVPFWDMWDGTIQFDLNVPTQGARAFFEQANEHRIVLSKILFWIDASLFGGLSKFLIFINILLMIWLWVTMVYISRNLIKENRRLVQACCLLMLILCFSWLQVENINWGYQSPFYLAYLLPLLALLVMANWIQNRRSELSFYVAITLGVLSTMTMANGLLTLPLLIVMLLLSEQRTPLRLISIAVVTATTFALWRYHYIQIPLTPTPYKEMFAFLLMFLGAPFGYIFHYNPLTMLVGVAIIIASVYLVTQWIIGKSREPVYLAVILFIVYVVATGVAASAGRAHFGLGAALASRYETPIMLLYSAFLLAFVHLNRDRLSTLAVVNTLLVIIPIILLTTQIGAIDSTGPEAARHKMQAALALNLGVFDNKTIGSIYPEDNSEEIQRIHRVAKNAIQKNISVFSLPVLVEVRNAIGKDPYEMRLQKCLGNVERIETIGGDNHYFRLSGWVFDERLKRVPDVAFLVQNNVIVGAALSGINRPDVTKAIDSHAIKSGFEGYTRSNGELSVFCAN